MYLSLSLQNIRILQTANASQLHKYTNISALITDPIDGN